MQSEESAGASNLRKFKAVIQATPSEQDALAAGVRPNAGSIISNGPATKRKPGSLLHLIRGKLLLTWKHRCSKTFALDAFQQGTDGYVGRLAVWKSRR